MTNALRIGKWISDENTVVENHEIVSSEFLCYNCNFSYLYCYFFQLCKNETFWGIFKHCDRIKYWFEGFIEKKNNMNFGVNSDLDNFDIVKSHSIMKSRLPWGQKVSGKWPIKYLKSVHSETKGRQSSNIHIQILMSQ